MKQLSVLPESHDVRRANRALLVIVLFAGSVFSVFAADLGMSEAVAFCLDALVVLLALQYLLRETIYSPLAVLRRHRDVSLLTAVGVTGLMLIFDMGFLNLASAFMPRLYSVIVEPQAASSSAWEMIFYLLGFTLLAPFYEELVFRGLVLDAYRNARSTLFAVIFTSVLFGLIHGSVVGFLAIFPGGVILALVRLKTGQLWTSILAHGLYNFVGTLLFTFTTDIPESRAAPFVGVVGIVVAAAVFVVAIRWLSFPEKLIENNNVKQRVLTTSLVVAMVIAASSIVLTTYEAWK